MSDSELDAFDIVLALLYVTKRGLSKKQIHLALYLASRRLERFRKALEFIRY
jgi:hypothetical protein